MKIKKIYKMSSNIKIYKDTDSFFPISFMYDFTGAVGLPPRLLGIK